MKKIIKRAAAVICGAALAATMTLSAFALPSPSVSGFVKGVQSAVDANGNTVVRSSATIKRYEILPLDDSRRDQWAEAFGINESTLAQCTDSWQRTMDIVGIGLAQSKDYLNAEKIAREANYLWLAQNAA